MTDLPRNREREKGRGGGGGGEGEGYDVVPYLAISSKFSGNLSALMVLRIPYVRNFEDVTQILQSSCELALNVVSADADELLNRLYAETCSETLA